jgi:hypothetical protein
MEKLRDSMTIIPASVTRQCDRPFCLRLGQPFEMARQWGVLIKMGFIMYNDK